MQNRVDILFIMKDVFFSLKSNCTKTETQKTTEGKLNFHLFNIYGAINYMELLTFMELLTSMLK